MGTYSPEQFSKKIKTWIKKQPSAIEKALKKSAEIVRGEVIGNHLSGPKMAKGVGSVKNATLKPRSGDLRSSINTKVKTVKNKYAATVGTAMVYAHRHEAGTFGMPKRPFLAPSLEKERSKIDDIILKSIMGAYKKS